MITSFQQEAVVSTHQSCLVTCMRVVHCQWPADINPATVSPECLALSLAFPVKLLLRYGKAGEGLVPFLHNWQMVKIFRTKKRLFLHIIQPTTHFQHLVCV